MRRHLKRFVTVFGLAWIAGAATIVLALANYAVEDFSLPDLIPMLTVLTVFGLLLTGTLLMPVLLFLRPRLTALRKILVYPSAGMLLAGLPAAVATGFPGPGFADSSGGGGRAVYRGISGARLLLQPGVSRSGPRVAAGANVLLRSAGSGRNGSCGVRDSLRGGSVVGQPKQRPGDARGRRYWRA